MMNSGPGCAGNIHGTTNSSDDENKTVGSVSWTYSGILLDGQSGTFTGSGLIVVTSLVGSGVDSTHTLIQADGVTCPPSPTSPTPVGRWARSWRCRLQFARR